MNKMNKKGFTLIEMLVVIAIIAVLVSIIIPTVSSATQKAAGAANAANLRAVYAELQTDILSKTPNSEGYITIAADGTPSVNSTAPLSAAAGACGADKAMNLKTDANGNYFVVYDNNEAYTIDYFANIAETGKAGS